MLKYLLSNQVRYLVAIFFLLILYYIIYNSEFIKNIDYKFYDISRDIGEKFSDEKNSSNNTVIVNIDEKSLQKLGQWPWSRNIEAELIKKIESMRPFAIAMNMIFSELDRSSPVSIDTKWDGLSSEQNYDRMLLNAISSSNTILAVYLHDRQTMSSCDETLFVHLRFQYLNSQLKDRPSILCNHKFFQKNISQFGFINLNLDSDRVLRRVAFFMNHNGVVIPSFALATLLSLDKDIAIDENNRLQLLDFSLDMTDDMEVLLNFYHTHTKSVSAIDVLEGRVDSDFFKDKIVLIGVSIIGSNDIYSISEEKKMSNLEIQATFIENVKDENFLIQPKIYQNINIFISFILSFIFLYLIVQRHTRLLLQLSSSIILVVLPLYLLLFYIQGVYVSIGYFIFPFLVSSLFLIFIFVSINLRDIKSFYFELQQSHSATVESISLVVGLRDGETGEHIQRTKNYVKLLAEYLYRTKQYEDIITPNYILILYEAAPLHDIGKIGIPDAVLKKEGKYTPEEYKIMQEHPLLAKAVIEKAMKFYDKNVFLEMAYNIAYYHHERWDGKGYPLGLEADEIPLEAQLMSMADVYDALVSKRCYKDAYDYEKTEEIIIAGRGKAFNPILVDAFIEIKEEFRNIHAIWQEE